MRKSWIAVGLIILVAGLAAGYRLGRVGGPGVAAGSASRSVGAPSETGGAAGDNPASNDGAQGAPDAASNTRAAAPVAGAQPSSAPYTPEQDAWLMRNHRAGSRASGTTDGTTGGTNGGSVGATDFTTSSAGVHAASAADHAPGAAPQAVAPAPPVPAPANPAATPPNPAASPRPYASPVPTPAPSPSPSDDPSSDRHPPTLQFLRFDPPEVQDGATAILSVGASDDLSGVKSIFGTIRSPSESAVLPFVAQDPGGGGVYTANIAIPKHAETGDWFVGTLQIVDRADNPLNVAYLKGGTPPGGALRVVSSESDSTAPTVHRVVVVKPTVSGGEHNTIEIDVDDDRSGVGQVSGTFQSPSKSAYIPFNCRANGDTSWVGDVPVPANADCGEWSLRQLRVTDKANNSAYLTFESPELANVGFLVSGGGGCDPDPPVIDGVNVAPTYVSSGSQVVITISAHDDGSGVSSLTGRFEGPVAANGQVPRIYFQGKPDPKNPDAPMVATITIPQLAGKGIWRVAAIEITDKANNNRVYNSNDPVLANAFVTVE
jgi:hypothetical protein